jgi:hypothetical protein
MSQYMQGYQATGITFWWETVDFGSTVRKIRNLAAGIRAAQLPPEIPTHRAKQMIQEAAAAQGLLGNKILSMGAGITNHFIAGKVMAVQKALHSATVPIFNSLFINLVRPAINAGRPTVPSTPFQREIPRYLEAIATGYESLQRIDEESGLLERAFRKDPFTTTVMNKLADVSQVFVDLATAITEPLKKAVDAASSGARTLEAILKWGSIGGGLLLLYWYVLKPDKKA